MIFQPFLFLFTLSFNSSSQYSKLPRLFIDLDSQSALQKDSIVLLSRDQQHYVQTVLRKKRNGAQIRCFDGLNGEWLCSVRYDGDGGGRRSSSVLSVVCDELLRSQPVQNDERSLTIFFAPIKKPRMKFLIEKCTELSVNCFGVVQTDYTNESSKGLNLEKLSIQAVEASEQSERLDVPTFVNSPSEKSVWTIQEILSYVTCSDNGGGGPLLICRERGHGVPVVSVLKNICKVESNAKFLIGPEGGWSPEEEALFDKYESSHENVHSISFGETILRAETCAIASATAWSLFHY